MDNIKNTSDVYCNIISSEGCIRNLSSQQQLQERGKADVVVVVVVVVVVLM
jgi:hypothetical protein